FGLEVAAEAGDGAAGAQGAEDMGDLAGGLPPDLGAGGALVGGGVLLVLVLVGHDEAVGLGAGVGAGEADGAVLGAGEGAHGVADDVELGAGGLEDDLLLVGDALGDGGADGVAA